MAGLKGIKRGDRRPHPVVAQPPPIDQSFSSSPCCGAATFVRQLSFAQR